MTFGPTDTGLRLADPSVLNTAITSQTQLGYAQAQVALGTNQATALVIGSSQPVFEVSTTASGTGVQLPISSAGKRQFIANHGAQTLTVYTNTGEIPASPKINATAGATGVTLATNTNGLYMCATPGQWYEIQGT